MKKAFLFIALLAGVAFSQTNQILLTDGANNNVQQMLDATTANSFITSTTLSSAVSTNWKSSGTPEIMQYVNDGSDQSAIQIRPTFVAISTGSTFKFDKSGNIRCNSLHNNTAADGASYEQDIRSGSDVAAPTVTAVSNCSVSSPTNFKYIRVGNEVVGSFRVTVDPTSTSTSSSFVFSLPVASDLTLSDDCSGVAFCGAIAGQGGEVTGDVTNNRGIVTWMASDVTSQQWTVSFMVTIK